IYADNYMLVNLDGGVQTKAERLASLRSGEAKYTAFSYSEPNIRVNPEGTGAVVIAKLAMKGTFRGRPSDGDYRVTHVYSKMNGVWKQVSAQATAITATASRSPSPGSNTSGTANKTAPSPMANANR
ncbi:MAG: nuclear transport factor 2 family protein, partial [Acidobacteria bacterium]|nr:nuclear transport factor 2 family protein [Acidobacteriota bacterium]